MGGACSTYLGGGREVRTGVWWGNLNERNCFEVPGLNGRIILKTDLQVVHVVAWTELIWLRIETRGGLL